jgi:hypothetical protein
MPEGFLMDAKKKFIFGLALFFSVTKLYAADWFIFPIREIEGFIAKDKGIASRALVDPRAQDLFVPQAQAQIVSAFTSTTAAHYPNSVVHASQIGDAIKGKYSYSVSGVTCGKDFVAPISRSYAVVLGVSRASYYEVDRGENVEILIPITLNAQLIKPERTKIVFSVSSTEYTPFVLNKKEVGTPAANAAMTDLLTKNTIAQMKNLLESVKKNFNPKETPVKLVDKAGDFFVADKGFEVGFNIGELVEARLAKNKDADPLLFKVLSTESGYSILKIAQGKPSIGEDYLFVFESPADDSSKPKLMPVFSAKDGKQWSAAVSDLFTKDIGFKAPFQLVNVDLNFSDTMSAITRQANCLQLEKYPSVKNTFDSRDDHPNYFIRFEMSQTPVFINYGQGGVKANESFATFLSAQVVDKNGQVIFSEAGRDSYTIERTGKQGISQFNAFEISLKNSVIDLTKNFLNNVKLDPKEFSVTSVKGGKFSIKGLELPPGQDIVFEVHRPLSAKINAKTAYMRLLIDKGAEAPITSGGSTVFSYSMAPDYPEVKPGDIVKIVTLPKPNAPAVTACGSKYLGKDSLEADHLLPVINQVAYQSSKYLVSILDSDFYSDTNQLLKNGFFKLRLAAPKAPELCFKPGYVVAKKEATCERSLCNLKFLTGMKLVLEKGGAEVKEISFGEQTALSNVPEAQISNSLAYRSMLSASTIAAELTKRFNSK